MNVLPSAGVYMRPTGANIAKVESRGKIYFAYAETKRILPRIVQIPDYLYSVGLSACKDTNLCKNRL